MSVCSIQDGCDNPDRCRAAPECFYATHLLLGRDPSTHCPDDGFGCGTCTQPANCRANGECHYTKSPLGAQRNPPTMTVAMQQGAVPRIAPPPDDTEPTNPKDALGSDKLPLHLWPNTATALGCLALQAGLLDYGRGNWRAAGVRASIYYDALRRHMDAWFEGQDTDPKSGLPHLGHALACIAIIVDAQAAGKLNDDRQFPGGYHKLMADLTPHVARLKSAATKSPQHYTIATAHD